MKEKELFINCSHSGKSCPETRANGKCQTTGPVKSGAICPLLRGDPGEEATIGTNYDKIEIKHQSK